MHIKLLMTGLALGLTAHTLSGQTDSLALQLDEVVVNARIQNIKVSDDGFHVKVAGTPFASSGTTCDLLAKLPFVKKSDSGIEVVGKGTPAIYIDGRKIHDNSELEQLASSRVRSVDVVTAPGARYSAATNAVIRIVTLPPLGDGISVSDRTTVGYKHYAYLFQQINLNYRREGLDIFGMLNYENYRDRTRYDNREIKYLQAGVTENDCTGSEFAKYPVYQVKAGMNFNIHGHSMGIFYDFAFRPASIKSASDIDRLVDFIPAEKLINTDDISRINRQHLVSAYYSGKSGNAQIDMNFDAIWQFNDKSSGGHEISSISAARDYVTENRICNRLLSGNINIELPLWKGSVTAGTEINHIHRTDMYVSDVDYIPEADITTEETSMALYATTDQTFGPLSAGIGMRWEYTKPHYYKSDVQQPDQSQGYHNLAPSIHLSMPIGNVNARLSYNRKISRPTFGQLSSAVRYLDRYTYESGNPSLRPVTRDYLSLSASWHDLAVELEYCSTNNYFMWQTSVVPGSSDVTLLRMENMPRFDSFSAYLNYSPTLLAIWHPSLLAGIEFQDLKLVNNGTRMRLGTPIATFRLNNSIKLPWEVWLDVDIFFATDGNAENAYIRGNRYCNLGIFKSFSDDRWSLRVQFNDVFGTSRMEFTTYDALSTLQLRRILDTRDIAVTARYNFNATRSRYRGQGSGNNDKRRL